MPRSKSVLANVRRFLPVELSFHHVRSLILVALVCVAAGFFVGCDAKSPVAAETIKIKSGNDQTGAPNEILAKKLVVQVFGAHRKGLLGGKGSKPLVEGQPVRFEVVSSSVDAHLVGDPVVKTSAGGTAGVTLQLGSGFGDCYVVASTELPNGKIKSVTFRATSGVVLKGSGQEGATRQKLSDPFQVKLIGSDNKPISGVPVFFTIDGDPHGASISVKEATTDENGEAETILKLGKKVYTYHVTAEIVDPEGKYTVRGLSFNAMAMNKRSLIIALVGGLAIFIFGMKQMSEGLQRVAGNRMRAILQTFAKNRFVAVVVGAVLTGFIQSSSASTVMIVGFVNAGLLTMRQAIGMVYGANIGTTVTGQMISFKLNNLAYPAIAVGLLMTLICKARARKFWGQAILGFGLLFLGMTIMSDTLRPLRQSPTFQSFFLGFDCSPVGGIMPATKVLWAILIGTLLTVAVQSSSATIGLTMALAGSGLINFYTAVPIILGDNIGTTITAVLASIGANRAAKQTACAHSLFNILGVVYMFALFFVRWEGQPIFFTIVNKLTRGDALIAEPQNIERHIAMAHSLFNVFNVILFLPFVGLLAHICSKLVPAGEAEEEEMRLQYLEPHLVDQPSIALDLAIKEVAHMTEQAWKNIRDAFECFTGTTLRLEQKIYRREDAIDNRQAEITDYLAQISLRSLTVRESTLLPALVHSVNDAERIGDYAKNIFELAQRRVEQKLPFDMAEIEELTKMYELLNRQCTAVLESLNSRDAGSAEKALREEERINRFEVELAQSHVGRLANTQRNIRSGVIFLDMVGNFEKIGDHLTNIAERAKLIATTEH